MAFRIALAFQEVLKSLETSVCVEPQEAYERRRCVEMAEKLCWPGVSIEPVRRWPGVTISEGMEAWRDFLGQASSGTIGLLMLALHKRLDPLTHGSIDEKTGLHRSPVEVISQVEERYRARMMKLAETLAWPHISYWSANNIRVLGPGEAAWLKCLEYGSSALVAEAVAALERRLRGEPEKTSRQWSYHDEEDEI